jgi:YD repeat-containing protein
MRLLITFTFLLFHLICIGSEISYEYDERGLVTKITDPRGISIEYTYGSLQQLEAKTYSGGSSVTFTHDLNGNRTSMQDHRGTTTYEYNAFDQLLKTIFPDGSVLEYERDSEGNRTKIMYPDGSTVNCVYDESNRPIGIRDSSGLTTLEYDILTGLLHKKTFPNGASTEFRYTPNGQVGHTIHRKRNGEIIQEFLYTFDKKGNRTKIETITPEAKKEVTYTYDKLNRLKHAEHSDGFFETFTYDRSGNRLTKTTPNGTVVYKYNGKNQLIQAGEVSFFYDSVGNLIKKVSPETKIEYFYDEGNRLTSCHTNLHHVDFEYDGDGARIAKIVNGVRTEYLVAPEE